MERFHICGMKRDRKQIMEYLQQKGVVELREVVVDNDEIFSRADTSHARTLFDRNADTAAHAVTALDKYAPRKKSMLAMLEGATPITPASHEDFVERRETVLHKAGQVLKLDREITEHKAEIARYDLQQEQLQPWLKLPVSQNFSGTKCTSVFIGAIDEEHSREGVLKLLAGAAPDLGSVHVEIVSSSPIQTCFYAIVLKRDAVAAEEALRAIGFARPPQSTSRLPEVKVKRLAEKKAEAQAAIEAARKKLEGMGGLQDDLLLLEDHMKWRSEKYRAIEYLAQTKHTFVLDGYIPSEYASRVISQVTGLFECDAEVTPVGPTEDPPVLLKNNKFSRPIESVLKSYALPRKNEVDPTFFMSIFYYVMFGLMFSDAAYGLILVVVSSVAILKFKNMPQGIKMFLNMFFWCGISTIFWGVMMSSYFGDLVTVVSGIFFGNEVSIPPLWIDPLKEPMTLLMFCFLIGIIHLTVGFIFKGVQNARDGDKPGIIFDAVFPIALAYGLILVLMTSGIFEGLAGFKLTLSPVVINICWAVAGISALGVIVTGGRESRNWAKRILKGLYALYNTVAGWLSDILSYSRLLALGLATGVIASVFNKLGSLFGSGIVTVIIFILIFIVGQLLNFFINVLGAYVHSNRLEFVEFFGKFYEGGGREFAPLRMNTKHYKIEEETQNV